MESYSHGYKTSRRLKSSGQLLLLLGLRLNLIYFVFLFTNRAPRYICFASADTERGSNTKDVIIHVNLT
ncbi:hypothetical protein M011DRAFT_224620 [Sporormia fimetaria CBS 119925]|uniref:Uncharacterized protein n=1 Tax=Sporormia fimetaria CBS 119925 TaxID=1340428 RepID=A0A6A6UYH1_9PLEO|nr:hypothetical protein M011DRAFT_224620 [Sporormia fimetaria CBS 119925]